MRSSLLWALLKSVLLASSGAAPVISILGANPDRVTLDPTVDISYLDPGATCTDANDGDLTNAVDAEVPDISKAGEHVIKYTCTNKAGQTTTATRMIFTTLDHKNEQLGDVEVMSTFNELPSLVVIGPNPDTIVIEDDKALHYVDPGATCNDPTEGNIGANIDADVPDISEPGTHLIKYSCRNKDGKAAVPKVRTVITVLSNELSHQTAFDCRVTDWAPWQDCTQVCGGGVQMRERHATKRPVSKEVAANGGATPCPVLSEYRNCNTQECSGDCSLEWDAWTPCTRTCGTGTQMQPVKKLNNRVEHDSSECPFIRQRVCNTSPCPNEAAAKIVGAFDGTDAGSGGVLAVAVRVLLAQESPKSMHMEKQRYLMDSVEATLDAAIRDPALFQVQLPPGKDSDKFASFIQVQLASVEVETGSRRRHIPCIDATAKYPCHLKLDGASLRKPGVQMLLQVLVSDTDEAHAIIAIMSTSTFPRDVSLMAQQSEDKVRGLLKFSEPKVVRVQKTAAGSVDVSKSITANVHYARGVMGRMKAHHWALLAGILLGVSAFFTIYKAAIIRAKEELENRRAWRKRNLQEGKEMAAQEQEQYESSMRDASILRSQSNTRRTSQDRRISGDTAGLRRRSGVDDTSDALGA